MKSRIFDRATITKNNAVQQTVKTSIKCSQARIHWGVLRYAHPQQLREHAR